MVDTTKLRRGEAIELLQPAILSIASRASVRALVIKGRTLADQGLRSPKEPSDVDILVDPREFPRLVDLLSAEGWRDRDLGVLPPLPDRPVAVAPHAITLVRDGMPVNLDLHRYFPGFLDRPDRVFDQLWGQRSSSMIANVSCSVPSVQDHWLLAMLHVARSSDIAQSRELQAWIAERTVSERHAVLNRATELCAEQALKAEFERAGMTVRPLDPNVARVYVEWTARVAGEPLAVLSFFSSLRELDLRDRFRYLWRAFFPPEQRVRVSHDLPHGRASLAAYYCTHLVQIALRAPCILVRVALQHRASRARSAHIRETS
jgi:hypothetical protein